LIGHGTLDRDGLHIGFSRRLLSLVLEVLLGDLVLRVGTLHIGLHLRFQRFGIALDLLRGKPVGLL